jgi:signal transduction histidine kinase
MTLARANFLRSLVLATGAAALILIGVEWLRGRDREIALERIAAAYQTEVVRQSCESDPQWFLAGPRTGRPRAEDRLQPDADVRLPRPSNAELPFEVFPFDEQFTGTSVASPRFPEEFRRSMRASPPVRTMRGAYSSQAGTGLQVAQLTGWAPGPCAVLLFRTQPVPYHTLKSVALFVMLFVVSFGVAFFSAVPVAARVRTLAAAARASARDNYSGMVPIKGNDEISSLGAVFNDTAADIRQRITDAQDREEALRRFVASTSEGVSVPLAALEKRLGSLDRLKGLSPDAAREVRGALRDAHHLMSRLQNLAAVAELRKVTDASPREPVDLGAVVDRVVASREALARASEVTIQKGAPDGAATISADSSLIEQAIGNVIDNAILYNRPGGTVRIDLRGYERDGRFSLRVIDNGRGVTDDEFAGLTANKRFRGDEATTRRPGGRGLGLALAREIADRFDLQLDLRRPSAGGFEVELSTRPKASP